MGYRFKCYLIVIVVLLRPFSSFADLSESPTRAETCATLLDSQIPGHVSVKDIRSAVALLKAADNEGLIDDIIQTHLKKLHPQDSFSPAAVSPYKKLSDDPGFASLNKASLSDVEAVTALTSQLLERGDRGFLSKMIAETEVRKLIEEGAVFVNKNKSEKIDAFFAVYPSETSYGRETAAWRTRVKWVSDAHKHLAVDPVLMIRAVGSSDDANPRSVIRMEKAVFSKSQMPVLGKISLNPFNERSLELHLAMGMRLAGTMKDANGQLWAVVVGHPHTQKQSPN